MGSDGQRRRAQQLHAGGILCERRGVGGAGTLRSVVPVSAGLSPVCCDTALRCACTARALYRGERLAQCAAAQVGERYQLVKLLGSGSFSSVCSALDAVTSEQARTRRAHACACRSPGVTARLVTRWPWFGGAGRQQRRRQVGQGGRWPCLAGAGIYISTCGAPAEPGALGRRQRAARAARRADRAPLAQVALKRIPDVLSSPEQAKRVLREVCILRRLRHPFLINLRDAFTRPSSSGAPAVAGGTRGRALRARAAVACLACAPCQQERPAWVHKGRRSEAPQRRRCRRAGRRRRP